MLMLKDVCNRGSHVAQGINLQNSNVWIKEGTTLVKKLFLICSIANDSGY